MSWVAAPTYTATIYVGRKFRYNGEVIDRSVADDVIRECVNEVGLCVTVTDVDYIYTNGREPGIAVGLINYPRYPRFPSTPAEIERKAMELAGLLKDALRQMVVSVVFPDKTVMLRDEEEGERWSFNTCALTSSITIGSRWTC